MTNTMQMSECCNNLHRTLSANNKIGITCKTEMHRFALHGIMDAVEKMEEAGQPLKTNVDQHTWCEQCCEQCCEQQ